MLGLKIERMLAAEFQHLIPLLMGLLLLLEITVLGWLMLDLSREILRSVAALLTRKKQAGDDAPPVEGVWPPAPKRPHYEGREN